MASINGFGRIQLWRTKPARLTRRWHRRGQRLSHRPAMHFVPLGQLADAQLLAASIAADRHEPLHP
jgi:hypothetical protein